MIQATIIIPLIALILLVPLIRVRLYFRLSLPDLQNKASGYFNAYIALWKIKLISLTKKSKSNGSNGDKGLYISILQKIKRVIKFNVALNISLGDAKASALLSAGVQSILSLIPQVLYQKCKAKDVKIRVMPLFLYEPTLQGNIDICLSFSLVEILATYIRSTIRTAKVQKENTPYEPKTDRIHNKYTP